MIKVKEEQMRKIIQLHGGVAETAKKAGITPQMVYYAIKGVPVGNKFIRAFLKLTGLSWDALFYYDELDLMSSKKGGREREGGELDCRGNHGAPGQTSRQAHTCCNANVQEIAPHPTVATKEEQA